MSNHYNKHSDVSFTNRIPEETNDTDSRVYNSLDFLERDYIFVKKLNSLIPKESTVLDLGCGSGTILLMLTQLRPDLHLTGKDISAYMIKRAKDNANKANVHNKIQWVHSPIGKKTSQYKHFDFIYSHFVAHHLDNITMLLEDIEMNLKEQGLFYVKDFIRPKDSQIAQNLVKSIASPLLSSEHLSLHYNSFSASFSIDEVNKAASHFKTKLIYTLKKSTYYWELSGYKNG